MILQNINIIQKNSLFLFHQSPSSQDHSQQSHSNVESVFSLAKVGGPLVRVEVGRDLELSRQRVKDAHPRFGPVHRLVVDHVVLARLAVVLLRLEPLLLNPEKNI